MKAKCCDHEREWSDFCHTPYLVCIAVIHMRVAADVSNWRIVIASGLSLFLVIGTYYMVVAVGPQSPLSKEGEETQIQSN